jgi:hypothetical protein
MKPIPCLLALAFLGKHTEGTMKRSGYSVEKHQNQWVVCAGGTGLLICEHKKTAVTFAKTAFKMLHGEYLDSQSSVAAERPEVLRRDGGVAA